MARPASPVAATAPPRMARVLIGLAIALLAACSGPNTGENPTPEPTEPPTEEPTPEDASDLVVEDLPACDDPVDSPGAFADGMPGSGIDFVHDTDGLLPPDAEPDIEVFRREIVGGVVAADLDGDGADDLYFPQINGANHLYWGHGDGTFTRDPGSPAVDREDELDQLASAADFDGDGDLDLVVGGFRTLGLLRNDGSRTFENVSDDRGLSAASGYLGTTAWADFDTDGDLDLFVGTYQLDYYESDDEGGVPGHDSLWRNDGDSFTDLLDGVGAFSDSPPRPALHAVWSDIDLDGDPDLLVINDGAPFFGPSTLWENQGAGEDGWQWVNRQPASGLEGIDFGMGALVSDLNDDGRDDIWTSDIGSMGVFRGFDDWSWVEVASTWGADLPAEMGWVSWSVVAIDLDGDGDPGVLITYGPLGGESEDPELNIEEQPDRFLVPTGGGSERGFDDTDSVFPEPQVGVSRGVGLADFNLDGVPDVAIGKVGQAPSLLLGRCSANHRLVVELRDPFTANRYGVGARVSVTAGERTYAQELRAGGLGTFSGSVPALFWGTGDASEVQIHVAWPDGTAETFDTVCGHCRVRITRTAR